MVQYLVIQILSALPPVVGVILAFLSYQNSRGKNIFARRYTRGKILEEIRYASPSIRKFYEIVNPPPTGDNVKHLLMILFNAVWFVGLVSLLLVAILHLNINPIIEAAIALGYPIAAGEYLTLFVVKQSKAAELIINGNEFGENQLKQLGTKITRSQAYYLILVLLDFFLFTVLIIGIPTQLQVQLRLLIYFLLVSGGGYSIYSVVVLFNKILLAVEEESLFRFLYTDNKDVEIKLTYAPAKEKYIDCKGKLVTVGKKITLIDNESYAVKINPNQIIHFSAKEVTTTKIQVPVEKTSAE